MEYEIVEGQLAGDRIVLNIGGGSFEDAIRSKLRAGWRLWGGIQIVSGSSNPAVWQAIVKDGTPGATGYMIASNKVRRGSDKKTITEYTQNGWVPYGPPSATIMEAWQVLVKLPPKQKVEVEDTDDTMMGNIREFKTIGRSRRRTARHR